MKNTDQFHAYLDEVLNPADLVYLTVECSTRNKRTANNAIKLLSLGYYAQALKSADPISYEIAKREYFNR
jgi:hypothetical protein